MIKVLVFLSSGLFLGWSLGASSAANIFGTAVGTRMVTFKKAALIISVFLILGAVISGSGASDTLGALGEVNTLPGAFVLALAAGLSVYGVIKFIGFPVSTSQAIIGAIIGWNFFNGVKTDLAVLTKIISAWVLSPILAVVFAFILYKLIKRIMEKRKIHLLRLDHYTRQGLILVGAFGAYSLGANNMANVMGVFTRSVQFDNLNMLRIIELNTTQQLFLLGGIAVAVGVFTRSKKVMMALGQDITKLSPIAAFVAVLSSSLVMFLFASEGLKVFLESYGLPSIPLVPVSNSQAIVGAIIGIGIARGGRNIKFKSLGNIALGWILSPVISALLSYIMLFFMQNVFMQSV